MPATSAGGGAETIYPDYVAAAGGEADTVRQHGRRLRASARRGIRTRERLQLLRVQGNVHLLAGAGGNVVVQVGESGSLLVDSKSAAVDQPDPGRGEARGSCRPSRFAYLLNTSADADHIGGNREPRGGARVRGELGNHQHAGGDAMPPCRSSRTTTCLKRMTKLPVAAWPTETFVGREKEFFFNGEPVMMYHVPTAHTDGDSIVFFRRSDVIATGDLLRTDSYPVIDLDKGGNVEGVIDALNLVLDLAVPAHHEEGGTFIVPGHGRICDEFDVLEYRDMVTIVRDRVEAMIKKGQTIDQVKAARPTRDYDSRYGATTGPWTTDRFVEAVYRSLKRP